MDKYTELEKEAQKFLDETDTMQFSAVELLTMFYRHKQQLTLTDVVGQSELLPKNNCTLNRQTCGKGSGCKYPHCHI